MEVFSAFLVKWKERVHCFRFQKNGIGIVWKNKMRMEKFGRESMEEIMHST